MFTELSDSKISMAELKVDNDKSKAKIEQLQDRVKAAEEAIKVREEADSIGGDEAAEKLKQQLKKQRQDIITKTAAATSGWNAAADADEKLTTEVEKAYKKGCDETKMKLE